MVPFFLDTQPQSGKSEVIILDKNQPFYPPMPADISSQRASDLMFAYPNINIPSFEEMKNRIGSGDEQALRKQIASEVDYQKEMLRSKATVAMSRSLGRPLEQQDLLGLDMQLSHPEPAGWPTDPRSVAEVGYAKEVMSHFSAL